MSVWGSGIFNIIMFAGDNQNWAHVGKRLVEEYAPDYFFTNIGREKLPENGKTHIETYEVLFSGRPVYEGRLAEDDLLPLEPALLDVFSPYYAMAIETLGRQDDTTVIPLLVLREWLHNHMAYWNTILQRYPVGLAFFSEVPHGGHLYVLYVLCKIYGVRVLFGSHVCTGYHYIVGDVKDPSPWMAKVIADMKEEYSGVSEDDIKLSEDFEKYYQSHICKEEDSTPYYMLNPTVSGGYVKETPRQRAWRYKKEELYRLKEKLTQRFTGHVPFTRKEVNLWRELDVYLDRWNELSGTPDLSKRYFYVPLHVQPEVSTLPMAGYYRDQCMMLEVLSASIPDNACIYVKEHPNQTYRLDGRTHDFPDQIARIPKTELLPQGCDTFQLMDGAVAVVSATGSALVEGIFRGIPGIMFGDSVYRYAPGVFHVGSLDDCRTAVKQILEKDFAITNKDLKIFMAAQDRYSYPFLIDFDEKKRNGETKEEMFARFAEDLIHMVDENMVATDAVGEESFK